MASPPQADPSPSPAPFAGVVERVAAASRAGGRPPVVVFDLDGTLLDNRPRSAAILRELAGHWAERAPQAARAVEAVQVDELAYLLTDNLRQLGITHPELVAEATDFWKERFFRDAYLVHDIEVRGARAFVERVYGAGAVVVYLTGRDLPLMGTGSWSSLRELGFPVGVVGTELVCKPEASQPDETFKREIAPTLARVGEVVASFDNEPANCNLFRRAFPTAATFFLDTQHAPGAPPLDEGVLVVRDFGAAPA